MDGQEEIPALPNEGDMHDMIDEAQMFEWGGVGLGRDEAYRVMLAMKHLLEGNPLKSVRFFGKILGRERDYYIVESEFKEGDSKPHTPQTQRTGAQFKPQKKCLD
jgi:radial spoke head protein 4A